MIKIVFCLKRRSHLSHGDFLNYWSQQHAPLVRRHAKALGIIKYVQSHGLEHSVNLLLRSSRGGPEIYDGIAELFFESADSLQNAMRNPSLRVAGQELLEDEKRFIELENSPLWVCEERLFVSE